MIMIFLKKTYHVTCGFVLQLAMYKERYDEFQTTIKKSEEMFTKFKTEMDKVSILFHIPGFTEANVCLISLVNRALAFHHRDLGLIPNVSIWDAYNHQKRQGGVFMACDT